VDFPLWLSNCCRCCFDYLNSSSYCCPYSNRSTLTDIFWLLHLKLFWLWRQWGRLETQSLLWWLNWEAFFFGGKCKKNRYKLYSKQLLAWKYMTLWKCENLNFLALWMGLHTYTSACMFLCICKVKVWNCETFSSLIDTTAFGIICSLINSIDLWEKQLMIVFWWAYVCHFNFVCSLKNKRNFWIFF
jgi:hypothetical protein